MPERIVTFVILSVIAVTAQEVRFEDLTRVFEYDRSAPTDEVLGQCAGRGGIRVCQYSYESPDGGRVPGILVLPDAPGKRPLILYGHWMMKGSPFRNKGEFLDEAVIMAGAGAISLLIDTPLLRPGFVEEADPLKGQSAKLAVQMAKDWRRALDLLLVRNDVDPKRVAYVGHSFSAGVGAKLTAIEKRIGSFVLMANLYSLREMVFDPDNADMVRMREQVGDDRVEAYLEAFPWDDSVHFARRSAPAAVFLQFGKNDKPIREPIARASFAHFGEPKRMKFYDAGHELNAEARVDRAEWLAGRLRLSRLDVAALRRIPPLK
jgi:cephalosporin-C deacetylase-like acetyl esterase